jgi:hypothetical protein
MKTMPGRRLDKASRSAATDLIAATARGNGIAQEKILHNCDLEAVAVECARWAIVLGKASFPSTGAFLAELRRAVSVLDSEKDKPNR